ncbi:Tll0287-like domain-containing protein [Deefgea rivuli]|uniref:Tll0287-like domain-containing protein n=1 Tax=Deefgea rivuli TaxID=400948 RepID=UPI00048391ED|nr:DUF3365 domain-containing protein [Deefgea rivuli]
MSAKKTPSVMLMLIALFVGSTLYFSGESIYRSQATEQARTVADLVENIGKWASQYRGLWVKDSKGKQIDLGSHLDTLVVTPSVANNSEITPEEANDIMQFHLKNPALIQREISDLTEKSASTTKFRITSDKYMNPKNAPNAFETHAINEIRKTNARELTKVENGELHYARALVATEACMRCHDTAAKAPAAVRDLYPDQGYGYEVGKVAGVIAVTIPYQYSPQTLLNGFDLWAWLSFAGLLLVLAIAFRSKSSK